MENDQCGTFEEIIVESYFEMESKDGDKTIHAYTIDGRILLITKPNPIKLAELKKGESNENKRMDYEEWLSDETLQQKKKKGTDGDLPEPSKSPKR